MAAGIVYLDVDDEITSAAQRIRSSTATQVALVVPYGSRIATSRMNFRLLSREAIVSNRRLSIVSGDAASRALAASAGLPVFASVSEYEDAMEASGGPGGAARAGAAAGTLAASETIAAVGPVRGGDRTGARTRPAWRRRRPRRRGWQPHPDEPPASARAEPRPDAGPSDDTARMAGPARRSGRGGHDPALRATARHRPGADGAPRAARARGRRRPGRSRASDSKGAAGRGRRSSSAWPLPDSRSWSSRSPRGWSSRRRRSRSRPAPSRSRSS